MTSTDTKPTAVFITRDLLFTSKVTGTANALGFHAITVGNVPEAVAKLAKEECRCLILDLEMPGLDVRDVISQLPQGNRPSVVAFGSHVLAERLQEAHDAGCDDVMPRSKFSATLPEILRRHLQE